MAPKPESTARLFVDSALETGETLRLNTKQAHYLANVMRLKPGAHIAVFNGRDGEWLAKLGPGAKRGQFVLECMHQTRAQTSLGGIHYLFAPLNSPSLDYLAQKACEMGVARLSPVFTQRTSVRSIDVNAIRANTIEAAQQCGLLSIPKIDAAIPLEQALDGWPADKPLIYCDEEADAASPLTALAPLPRGPLGVLVGPEGGFSNTERHRIKSLSAAVPVSLGPRLLRADTAAVAILALVQAVLGDWRAIS